MSRNTDATPSRASTSDAPEAGAAPTASAATAVPSPTPATAAPIDAAASPPAAGPPVVDAPSLVPDQSSVPGDLGRGGAAPGSLAPEVAPDAALADPFDLDLDAAHSGTPEFGAGDLELPDAPVVADLPGTAQLDVGVDWNDLGDGNGSLDGRGGGDTFESDSNATGPADPSAMVSDGASDLTTESDKGTLGDWIGSIFGADSAADEAFDTANAAAAKAERGGDTDVNGLTTPGVTVGDDGVSSPVRAPTGEGAGMLQGYVDRLIGVKNFDGSITERHKQMPTQFQDGLPPDHPDYVGAPVELPPGSAADESIQQSLDQGLGGDRGGDVDPFDDPQAGPTDGEQLYDPYDSVVDPGLDGFLPSLEVDESYLPDATDVVDPYLADG